MIKLTDKTIHKFHDELVSLKENKRFELGKQIEAARLEGDLKENSGYHALKEEQANVESRILELESILKSSESYSYIETLDSVIEGLYITVEILDLKKEISFFLGSRMESSILDVRVYSKDAPLCTAIYGKKVGDIVEYVVRNGVSHKVLIKNIEHYNS